MFCFHLLGGARLFNEAAVKTYSRGSAVWQAEGVMRQRGGELRGVDPAGTAKTTSSYDLSSSSVHGRVSRSANTHIIYMHTHTRRLNLGRTEHPANKIISKQPLFVWPSVTSGIRFRIFSCMTNKYVYRWLRPNGSRLRRCYTRVSDKTRRTSYM